MLPPSVATIAVTRSLFTSTPHTAAASNPTGSVASPAPVAPNTALPAQAVPAPKATLPSRGVLSTLPVDDDVVALTVDDGVDTNVVRLYTEFAKATGVRLTFFVNGTYPSWTDNAALLRPLVDSGQIQLGNHTFSHPDLTSLGSTEIANQIRRNDDFLKKTFGVDARPYLRPPYGKYNKAVDAVAADLGYSATTMWSGSLADSTVITEDYIVKMADTYFRRQNIVIGHLNHPPVTHVFGRLADLLAQRGLRTVTLNDVFIRST